MSESADESHFSQNILIVDDHSLLNETLVESLMQDKTLSAIATTSVNAAVDLIEKNGRYDVILADYNGPGMGGLDGVRILVDANDGSVALFSGVANWLVAERAMRLGASGFIPKTLPLKTVGHAIRLIADGEVYLPSDMLLRSIRSESETDLVLKPREMRVLALLCEGMPNKEIGRELGIEETTVKLDVKMICRKLDVRNRTQVVIKAMEMELFKA